MLVVLLLTSGVVAFADYEAVPDTPYGISIYSFAEEIDAEALATIINGHGLQRIVDYFGSVEVITDYENRASY